MDDRNIMENLLFTTKGACDLYLHGTIESTTSNVHDTFTSALADNLSMQNNIYTTMSDKGWYTTSQAQEQQISQVKQKYSSQSQSQS